MDALGIFGLLPLNGSGGSPTPPSPPSPSTIAPNDVNFYDYDGTLVNSYSKTDFLALSALPDNPSHEGLTAQGWNWSLADAQAYVTSYGKLEVGQMYVTDDGKTRIHITLGEGRLKPYLGFYLNGTITIDWGDGSATETDTTSSNTLKTYPHTYAAAGNYVILIEVATGSTVSIAGTSNGTYLLSKDGSPDVTDRVYSGSIKAIEIGNNISISSYAFSYCVSLQTITLYGITTLNSYTFYYSYSLRSITLPSGFTIVRDSAFYYCYSLRSISLPKTTIGIGSRAFYTCLSLQAVTIPSNVTNVNKFAFNGAYSLQTVTIPSSVSTITDGVLSDCYSLTYLTIPNGVSSMRASAVSTCHALSSITIPRSVTSIGDTVFYNCQGLGKIVFERTTPPTISSSNTFLNIPTDCVIYVPSGTLSAYTSATNYPSSSTYTYVEY